MEDRILMLGSMKNKNQADAKAYRAAMRNGKKVIGRRMDGKYHFISAEARDEYFDPKIEDAQAELDSIAILPEGLANAFDLVTKGPVNFMPLAQDLSWKHRSAQSHLDYLKRDKEGSKIGNLPDGVVKGGKGEAPMYYDTMDIYG
jgi:hypothetical protein